MRCITPKKVPHPHWSVKLNLYYTKSCLQGMGERGETIHNLGVHRTIKNRLSINCQKITKANLKKIISR
ncbi:hypothetical protein MICCA_1280047 [Microcystis aeruginosa PCC 9432]|uniref:Uncharacterized protein n=2 Tax=Microcystis TaxID=1125 RepID=A0A822L7Y8_MICAE|nr:MAG: hypothetical protein DWQ54_17820 [Microcystis flos-aquae TF09]TRT97262.1 MAG: hypothetical protein EWV62_10725 [Microcystis aeruginosa Ma_OC_LR_19540900_S633]TRU00327.1 MAG: hypothetical protein EWV61_14240 [Microcystis aeruginosa Ma_AC_P_19900807_S300]TRU06632.1 MAG: hypothetical protein EWV59_19560 [Microcystis aeruginosa Ma_MB_F_20061100_S19D]TRU12597.1 MAG: hypothetical protein EWV58_16315 [Microcystis aeruginosa Ma_MB_F_20061100_S19]CCH91300.1 hypothetical protein MICCA_1280047 [M